MDLHLANKVEIGQLFSEFAIHSAQFASVNEYSLYATLMLLIIKSESVVNYTLSAADFIRWFAVSIRSEPVASVNPAIGRKWYSSATVVVIRAYWSSCWDPGFEY